MQYFAETIEKNNIVVYNSTTMLFYKEENGQQDPEITMLKEWLLKMNGEGRAYIKGASQALLYAQEISGDELEKQHSNFQ